MRIAFVIYSLTGGGAERVTTILSQYWANTGHSVTVLTFAEESANFYKVGPGVGYESLHYPDVGSTLLKIIALNLSRILILRRRLKALNPDVVIGIMSTNSALVALSCIGLPCRTVGTEHSYPLRAPLPPLQHFIRNISYRFLDAVVVLSAEAAQWVRAHTWAKAVHIIPNPLAWPIESLTPFLSPEDTCSPEKFITLAVGRLVPEKGFIRLVDAFSELAADYPSWDLVILGTGPERTKLETRRDQLNLTQRIFFPGRAGNVGDWYKRASIFALTSLIEGFPVALLEAMAYGLPVVSTDCDTGPRDIIEDNVNGLLVAQNDHNALVAALRQLMHSETLRARLAEKASGVSLRYAVDRISRQWQAVFGAIASRE